MEEKFSLQHNSYLIFMLNYAPIIIFGIIAIVFLHKYIPDVLEYIIVFAIFVIALYKGINPLKSNKRILVVTDKTISLCKYKKKQPIVLVRYNNDDISKIDGTSVNDSGEYLITKQDGSTEILEISTGLKPNKELVLKINNAFSKIFCEKLELSDYKDLDEYKQTNAIPKDVINFDKTTKAKRISWAVINTFLVVLPSGMGILASLWILFSSIKLVLEILVKICGG